MRPVVKRPDQLSQRLIAIAALLAGVSLFYGLFGGGSGDDIVAMTAPDQRGYYLTDATLTEMGLDGRPRIVLHAKSIEQQVSDQSILMSDLQLDYKTQQSGPWTVTALHGRMPPDRTTVLLSGDVEVTGSPSAQGTAVIRTDELSYDTKANFVQTARPVSVVFGAHELHGRGLRANLNTGTLKLESNVNGRFAQ